MASFTEDLLQGNITELRSVISRFTLKLTSMKLDILNSDANNEVIRNFETRVANLNVDISELEAVDNERQQRKDYMPVRFMILRSLLIWSSPECSSAN
jgi:hypothetical protein